MKDYFGYEEKTCVITGASSGMGKAAAKLLIELGADVYVLSRSKPDLDGIRLWIQTDVGDRASIDSAFAQLPVNIDRFFGVAGVSGVNNTYEKTFTVDFVANKYIAETYLVKRVVNGGAIAFVTSSSGVRWSRPDIVEEYKAIVDADGWDDTLQAIRDLDQSENGGSMAYMLAKRAMNYYIASKAADFSKRDIRINFVMPCSTSTNFVTEFLGTFGGNEQVFLDSIGNGKDFARPEAMAKAIVYINSDLAEYVSGHGLIVDYGLEAATLCGQRQDMLGMNLL